MKIGIVSDKYKDPEFIVANRTAEVLRNLGVEVVNPESRYEHKITKQESEDAWDDVDIAISVGGDGTFLHTCKEIYGRDIPLIGVNLGQLGFMTEIHLDDLEKSLEKIVRGEYFTVERMMLEVKLFNRDGELLHQDYALNDAVLYRGEISRIIPCVLKINGNYIQTFKSDGIIVAGPTGSTGYALSCGGPIVDPKLELMLVTPISPHSLQNRTYVVSPEDTIEISIAKNYPFAPYLSMDGRENIRITRDENIQIRRADKCLKILRLEEEEFFKELPKKLYARGVE